MQGYTRPLVDTVNVRSHLPLQNSIPGTLRRMLSSGFNLRLEHGRNQMPSVRSLRRRASGCAFWRRERRRELAPGRRTNGRERRSSRLGGISRIARKPVAARGSKRHRSEGGAPSSRQLACPNFRACPYQMRLRSRLSQHATRRLVRSQERHRAKNTRDSRYEPSSDRRSVSGTFFPQRPKLRDRRRGYKPCR